MKETREEWSARIEREIRKYRWSITFGYGLVALGILGLIALGISLSMHQAACR